MRPGCRGRICQKTDKEWWLSNTSTNGGSSTAVRPKISDSNRALMQEEGARAGDRRRAAETMNRAFIEDESTHMRVSYNTKISQVGQGSRAIGGRMMTAFVSGCPDAERPVSSTSALIANPAINQELRILLSRAKHHGSPVSAAKSQTQGFSPDKLESSALRHMSSAKCTPYFLTALS
ncbi:uncharacterized protein FOMMEDRAFT_156321 [Fomitiporia mediterranea MF3/22]|uniref:uncharacterized protein n=1 Tax=Fomitiporia mediterranea (strain MF3/22) TaxID=694068 RepID=UPI0004407A6A|nr:uncharacterized protein FOMMEDRAFT_156321 [Fomitiporia mediterranea MF3/22]EJD02958.1 hypothetical protein FOMMEDRAFT_156321 [Fomitiporia mediterranea MF3/22]